MRVGVCVLVPVLRIRPTLSVHGAETPYRNEVKRCHFALQYSLERDRPMLYFGERVREI